MKVIEFLTGYIGEDNVVLYDGVIGQDIIDELFSNTYNGYFNKLIEVMELKNIFELHLFTDKFRHMILYRKLKYQDDVVDAIVTIQGKDTRIDKRLKDLDKEFKFLFTPIYIYKQPVKKEMKITDKLEGEGLALLSNDTLDSIVKKLSVKYEISRNSGQHFFDEDDNYLFTSYNGKFFDVREDGLLDTETERELTKLVYKRLSFKNVLIDIESDIMIFEIFNDVVILHCKQDYSELLTDVKIEKMLNVSYEDIDPLLTINPKILLNMLGIKNKNYTGSQD